MKIELQINKDLKEPSITIQAPALTKDIQQILEKLKQQDTTLVVYENEKLVLLDISDIYLIKTEEKSVILYTKTKRYRSQKRLYELEDLLGSNFMRISKNCIIHLKQVDYVEPSLSGSMQLVMKNGLKDYISRSYLPAFKKYLGI